MCLLKQFELESFFDDVFKANSNDMSKNRVLDYWMENPVDDCASKSARIYRIQYWFLDLDKNSYD